ncbi:MAG: GWxTD domain-containing protein [FCB group bacterium]|nr:GWxTD domain-containing protein [FCB group bacterium]
MHKNNTVSRFPTASLILLLFLLLFNCHGEFVEKQRPGKMHTHEMWVNTSYSQVSDKVKVTLQLKVPNNYLVFIKKNNQFSAGMEYTITVTDKETDKQAYKKSWSDEIFVSYYEDTRDGSLFHVGESVFDLLPGKYIVSAIIEDRDNHHQWRLKEKITISPPDFWSEIIPMVRVEGILRHIGNRFKDIDTLFCRFQLTDPFNTDTDLIYKVIQDSDTLTTQTVKFKNLKSGDFYYIPLALEEGWSGNLTVNLKVGDRSQDLTVKLYRDMVDNYLIDQEESIKWMSVILPHADYQQLKRMEHEEQRIYLVEYWKSADPTPSTEFNELLDEFYKRVLFCNENFGVLTEGWRSDQGRIYIKYGKPATVENTASDGYGRSYQIWYYQSNKQFVFVNDGFGDYRLVRELN